MKISKTSGNYIVHLSTYPPRECGLATFTSDLTSALDKKFNPAVKTKIVSVNESPTSIYHYGNKIINTLVATELENYVTLAKEINKRPDVKIVNIQHEFGIFGGDWGSYLIPFLQVLEKPIVVTLHSVIPNPEENLRNIVRAIAAKAKALIVMNKLSQLVLESDYGILKSKIILIPHGIPQTIFEPPARAKEELGFSDKLVLSTFGLLDRNKGLEYAVRALPAIVKKFSNVVYLILGATHPLVRKQEGESYRNFLIKEVEKLGLKDRVKFYNKYLTLEEIIQFLKATDVYIFPTLGEEQSVSGTLSYALGCGRPTVATPTNYAKYIVSSKNGVLVDFKSSDSIAKAVSKLLADEKLRRAMSREAYEGTRNMIWPNVAAAYFKVYKKFADVESEEKKLPEIKLDHLMRLTDGFGILHHARYSKPEPRFGYSLDDNARAALAALASYEHNRRPEILDLIKTYLKFIGFTQRQNGSFANIVSYSRKRDKTADEDVQGRAIWALGCLAAADFLPLELRIKARKLFLKARQRFTKIEAPRAAAFTMTGIYFYLRAFPGKELVKIFKRLADYQLAIYRKIASADWQWFEDELTYSNSKLPESLLYAYKLLKEPKYLKVAETTLDFLSRINFERGKYIPIGQNGWYFRDKKRAYFDQQPEDTASMVQTKVLAYQITKNEKHLTDAFNAFQWFLGKNHLNQMVYDELTGGCCDGVGQYGINLNQGAEATTAYLLARLAFEDESIKEFFANA